MNQLLADIIELVDDEEYVVQIQGIQTFLEISRKLLDPSEFNQHVVTCHKKILSMVKDPSSNE